MLQLWGINAGNMLDCSVRVEIELDTAGEDERTWVVYQVLLIELKLCEACQLGEGLTDRPRWCMADV
jgi:hypothetical protein